METRPADFVRCRQCGHDVPRMAVCVRCGDPLGEEIAAEAVRPIAAEAARSADLAPTTEAVPTAEIAPTAEAAPSGGQVTARGPRRRVTFAAAPWERAAGVSIVSTVFPQLPHADVAVFRAALIAGTVVIVALAAAGLFPVALTAAAVLVPVIVVVYLYDVDVYEDEPIRVVALTMVWGALAGAVLAGISTGLLPVTPGSILAPRASEVLVRTVVLPLVGGALMLLGPLALLPYRRFNDVLDGATFGVASAVAFTGAQTVVTAVGLFSGGLRPGGNEIPWILRLMTVGVELPLIAAAAIGGLTGALWLRYRAPVSDREALGAAGRPVAAAVLAGILLVGAAAGIQLLGELATVLWLAVLAALGLAWLRRVIHLGLLQEASEIPIGAPLTCANCGHETPEHTFCGVCGIALGALPKSSGTPARGHDRAGQS